MSFLSDVTKSLFGGSDLKQSSSSRLDPQLRKEFLDNLKRARGVADSLDSRDVLGAGETFGEGLDILRGAIGAGRRTLTDATGAVRDTIGRSPATVTAGRFGEDIGRFLNPVTDAVVDRSLSDIDRSRQLALQGNEDDALAAGAFGGSRHGVAEAETNRGFADIAARTAAELRSRAFDKAADLQGREFDRTLTADRANQAAGLDSTRLDQAGAGTLGDIGESMRRGGAESATALANLGLTERGFEQEQLDADRLLELERQRIRNEALGINPAGGAGNVLNARRTDNTSPGFLGGLGDFFGSFG